MMHVWKFVVGLSTAGLALWAGWGVISTLVWMATVGMDWQTIHTVAVLPWIVAILTAVGYGMYQLGSVIVGDKK